MCESLRPFLECQSVHDQILIGFVLSRAACPSGGGLMCLGLRVISINCPALVSTSSLSVPGKDALAGLPGSNTQAFRCLAIVHSFWLLPCFPFQKGQNGQSSPWGK